MATDASQSNAFTLSIEYSGALADNSALQFSEYAASLDGWQQFFRLASDLCIRSEIDLAGTRPGEVLEIRVTPERKGSFTTTLVFVFLLSASEWIKKGAGDSYAAFRKRLLEWYRDL